MNFLFYLYIKTNTQENIMNKCLELIVIKGTELFSVVGLFSRDFTQVLNFYRNILNYKITVFSLSRADFSYPTFFLYSKEDSVTNCAFFVNLLLNSPIVQSRDFMSPVVKDFVCRRKARD